MRKHLLWEYRAPAHPILYAGAIVLSVVCIMGSLENWARDGRPELYAFYAAPPLVAGLMLLAMQQTPVRIYADGLAPSRPLALAWWRSFIAWSEVDAVYPASYDVTGGAVSPFAASDGKVTQKGLRLEMGARFEVVRFTPGRFERGVTRSEGFEQAFVVVADLFAAANRPMVPAAVVLEDDERQHLVEEAAKPFLPFAVIIVLFAGAAPALWVLLKMGIHPAMALLAALCLPLGTSAYSYKRGRRRNNLLARIARSDAYQAAGRDA